VRDQTAGSPTEVPAGLRVSLISFAWTVVAGASAIAIGILYSSLVLVAFGAIALIDAVGSGALILHFRHALRHDAISERHERWAHLLVTAGMSIIGLATMADSAYRLAAKPTAPVALPGTILSAVSIVVLLLLSRRKRSLAERIPSAALNADGWLSAAGAVLAAAALVGTGLRAGLGWWWTDPLAAGGVGAGALVLSIALIPKPKAHARRPRSGLPTGGT
jgi:divalent metal cation (Fe/Co/Zn/Cd) transporter